MDSGYYAACTALVSRTQALDTIANNLANASTVGFRAEHNVFSSVLANAGRRVQLGPQPGNQQLRNSERNLAGREPRARCKKPATNSMWGLKGPATSSCRPRMVPCTRATALFRYRAKASWSHPPGDAVMGDKGVISILPGTVSISADGTISSNGAVTGKLKVVEFPAGTELTSRAAPIIPRRPTPQPQPPTSSVRQGMLESSNVNPIASMVELVNAQRSAEMMQRALSMFNSEIDKTATQDLPKVG